MSVDLYDIFGAAAVFLTKQERAIEAANYEPKTSRRCLICADINPCLAHTNDAQEQELARNYAAIAALEPKP